MKFWPLQFPPSAWQFALSCCALFLCGSFQSLAVFSVPVEQAGPSGELNGVWTKAMGYFGIVSTLASGLTGVFLHGGSDHFEGSLPAFGQTKTDRIRIIFAASAAAVSCLYVAARGVEEQSRMIITIGVSAQGFAYGSRRSA